MKQYVHKALALRKWVKVAHHIPGRVRLKYKLGLVAHFASYKSSDIEQALASIDAFHHYKLNPSTGSIVIEYDATLVNPEWIDALFSDSQDVAEQAAWSLVSCLSVNGDEE